MNSSRRRSSPSNGDTRSSAALPVASSSASSTTTRRSRRNGSSSSSSSAKKRRYEEIVNRCRNPFCGAELENKHLRYCEASRVCQLHRGIMLNCAWPNAPREKGSAGATETTATTKRGSSASVEASVDTPAAAATASRRSSASTTASTDANGDVAMVGGDKRPRTATPTPVEGTTKRLKLNGSDLTTGDPATVSPTTTATTAAQQVKAAAIEVVPLGIGSRGGGGGRYVQSGNRSAGAPSLPPPSVSTSTTSDVPAARAPSAQQLSPRALLPTPGASLAPPPPSRVLSRANSLPVTTTNKSRDPRVRFTSSAAAAAGSGGDADAAATNNGGLKLISTADYLSNRRNRVAGNAPAATGGANNTASSAASTAETLLSSRPPEHHRTLERASSSSSMTGADAGSSSYRGSGSSGSAFGDPNRQLRRASSDTTAPFASHDHLKTDRYPPHGQQHPGGYHGPPSSSAAVGGDRGHGDYHHDRSQYQQDRPPLSRTSSSSSVTSSSLPRRPDVAAPTAATASRVTPSEPRMSRAERLFCSVLRPMFSHSDPFLKLIITRMASFLPNALSPIRNKTTKPRKLQFYLDYAERVHKYCGKMVKLEVKDGKACLAVAGREWLSITGSSTSDMYQEILEKILTESERWRDLILELKRMLSEDHRRLGSHAIPGVTFLKFWSSMKKKTAEKASDFDFQTSFMAGREHYHWTFAVGNVEIGSGTAKEKLAAFKSAASSAAAFGKALVILPDSDKHNVANEDSRGVSDRTSPRSTRSSPDGRTAATRETTENSFRRSSTSERTPTVSTPTVPDRGVVATPAPAGLIPTAGTSATAERIVEEPTATAEDATEQRTRSDSLNAPEAAFSPVVRSESDHENESDRMSISDNEDDAKPVKSAGTNAVAPATTVATGIAGASVASGASAPVIASQQRTVPVSAQTVPVPAPTQSALAPVPAPRASAPAPVVPAPTAAAARATPSVVVTIPVGPSAAPTPLASPACRFCAGIQKTNPDAKCLRCQKKQPKTAPTSAAPAADAPPKATPATRTIDQLHSFFMHQVYQPAASAAKALLSSSADPASSSANVIESLPSSASSTPRNDTKK